MNEAEKSGQKPWFSIFSSIQKKSQLNDSAGKK